MDGANKVNTKQAEPEWQDAVKARDIQLKRDLEKAVKVQDAIESESYGGIR